MKLGKVLYPIIYIVIIGLIIYILLNLIHFAWSLTEPEGFWSFSSFIGVLGLLIIISIIIIGVTGFVLYGLFFLFTDFPTNFTLLNIVKPLGYVILLLVIMVINIAWGSGFSMYVNNALSDRFSYINRSEKLFSQGRFKHALNQAKIAYKKYERVNVPAPFFFISRYFQETDFGEKRLLDNKYSTTVNYALCLDKSNIDLDSSEVMYNKGIALSKSYPSESERIENQIFPLQALAELQLKRGKFNEAEKNFNLLLTILDKTEVENLEYLLVTQEAFASYYLRSGDIDKVRKIRQKNVKIWEDNFENPKSEIYLSLLLGASTIELISGNMEDASAYLVKAKPLAEKHDEKVFFSTFLLLKALYCDYASKNGFGNENILEKGLTNKLKSLFKKPISAKEKFLIEAEKSYLQRVEIEKDLNGNESVGYISALARLGNFYLQNGNDLQGIEIFEEAKAKSENFRDKENSIYQGVLIGYIHSKFIQNGYDSVKVYIDELENSYFNAIKENYSFLSESQKETYNIIVERSLAPINSLYVQNNTPETLGRLYNNIIATKELALNSNETIRKFTLNASDSIRNEYYSVIKRRDSIQNLNSIENIDQKAYNKIILEEKNIQDKIRLNPEFREFNPRSITWEDIKARLKEKQASIEFLHVKVGNIVKYFALIIRKDLDSPVLVSLFDENKFEELFGAKGVTKERITNIYLNKKDSVYNLIWKPIENHISGLNTIYISLSGVLHSVSFAALLNDRNIDFHILSSTRKLISPISSNIIKSALLVGTGNSGDSAPVKKNSRSNFSSLLFTNYEIKHIEEILKTYPHNIFTSTLNHELASEANFYSEVKALPNLIHLATHGYYYSDKSNSPSPSLQDLPGFNGLPMLNSGIILFGANTDNYLGNENDGFVSAQEIGRLNLSSVELAVLSACETGLGKTMGSEGVFGLQRGFKLAGAKSLLMSLWKVPDEQTSKLMVDFYSNYLIKKMSMAKALKEAQLKLSKEPKHGSPYYWGGFILLED